MPYSRRNLAIGALAALLIGLAPAGSLRAQYSIQTPPFAGIAMPSMFRTPAVFDNPWIMADLATMVVPADEPVQRWYAAVDALPLMRDTKEHVDFQALGGDVVLSTASLDAKFASGLRTTLRYELTPRFDLEASYFGLNDWSDRAWVRDESLNSQGTNGNLAAPFGQFVNPGVAGTGFNNFAAISYTSNIDNVELYVRQRLTMPRAPLQAYFLYGLRYVSVDETFLYETTSRQPGPNLTQNNVDLRTTNDLFAVELGSQTRLQLHNLWMLELDVKGAVAHNRAELSSLYTHVDELGNSTLVPGARAENRTSFLGDVSLVARYFVTPTLTLRFGYHATAITGLALGAQNFEADYNVLTLGPTRLDHRGQAVYHGPTMGLVWVH